MDAIIEVNQLTKKFGSFTAVNNITFEIDKGEIFGILGPNGAGKTTTIRLMTGILIPDNGEVRINGLNLNKNAIPIKMQIGVIPEFSNIYQYISAKENIILSGRFFGISAKELGKKADALLEKFELKDKKNQPVKTFSKGLRQRVSIASAIVHDPGILFLDEPTSGLDIKSQKLIKDIIREINRRGTTIIFSSHNLEDVNLLCDRVCIINKGSIIAVDTPENLKKNFKDTSSILVSFETDNGIDPLAGNKYIIKREKSGDKWFLHTNNTDRLIKSIVKSCEEKTVRIKNLETCNVKLEDIFLNLTEDKK